MLSRHHRLNRRVWLSTVLVSDSPSVEDERFNRQRKKQKRKKGVKYHIDCLDVPRWVVMHLCQEVGGLQLVSIAEALGLKRTGSIPTTIKKLKEMMAGDDALVRKLEKIRGKLC